MQHLENFLRNRENSLAISSDIHYLLSADYLTRITGIPWHAPGLVSHQLPFLSCGPCIVSRVAANNLFLQLDQLESQGVPIKSCRIKVQDTAPDDALIDCSISNPEAMKKLIALARKQRQRDAAIMSSNTRVSP